MAEELRTITGDKEAVYEGLIPQLKSLTEGESDPVANLANISAALKSTFDFLWVGFYLIRGEQLVLGPFQGPVACTRILKGKGVCGTAWSENKLILVKDVELFPGHIACSSLSKSEIVIPLIKHNSVVGVLDIDSEKIADFDQTDAKYLSQICQWISSDIV